MKTRCITGGTAPEDMQRHRAWVGGFFTHADHIPISFAYGDVTWSGIPHQWNPVVQRRAIDANIIEIIYEGTDQSTGLHVRVEGLEYRDYPVSEWTVWFSNIGDRPTPILRDIQAINAVFPGASPVLYHCNGDFYREDGYTPQETPVPEGEMLRFTPNGGRPCDGAFPYFRLAFAECGLTLAVGWPAQWEARFIGVDHGVAVTAKQEHTSLRLLPGESIRTPRVTILSWTGDSTRAVNLWRRWYLDHVLPRPNGLPLEPLLVAAGTDEGEEHTGTTEENQIKYQDRYKRLGPDYDVWWIDAGWYPCYNTNHEKKWVLTGTWEPDPERFPHGLKPVAQNAAKNGAKLLIWFEPERVAPGSWLDRNHPEWLLKISEDDRIDNWRLLNLGNPDCRGWLTEHVCDLIQNNGIGIYRQDFNFPPLGYWQHNEPPERQGINENLHVQGYLQYWDDLLTRNPGLWIDSCASGGRRNDLETMRRAVPLHYTDYGYGLHRVKLAFQHTLFSWLPYFKGNTLSWDLTVGSEVPLYDEQVDSFSYHCGMAPMFVPAIDIRRDDYDFALCKDMIGIWRRASQFLLYGDYNRIRLPTAVMNNGSSGSSTNRKQVKDFYRESAWHPVRRKPLQYTQPGSNRMRYTYSTIQRPVTSSNSLDPCW